MKENIEFDAFKSLLKQFVHLHGEILNHLKINDNFILFVLNRDCLLKIKVESVTNDSNLKL